MEVGVVWHQPHGGWALLLPLSSLRVQSLMHPPVPAARAGAHVYTVLAASSECRYACRIKVAKKDMRKVLHTTDVKGTHGDPVGGS